MSVIILYHSVIFKIKIPFLTCTFIEDMTKRLLVELLWLVATLVLIIMIMLPVYQNAQNFDFFKANIASIFLFVTFTRYIFLLRHTFLYRNKWPKGILFFLCIPIFLFLMDGVFEFQSFLDDNGAGIFYEHLTFNKQKSLGAYTRSEFIFFGVASLVATIVLPIRLIISTWRDINQ